MLNDFAEEDESVVGLFFEQILYYMKYHNHPEGTSRQYCHAGEYTRH
jgi:hypothetical protein